MKTVKKAFVLESNWEGLNGVVFAESTEAVITRIARELNEPDCRPLVYAEDEDGDGVSKLRLGDSGCLKITEIDVLRRFSNHITVATERPEYTYVQVANILAYLFNKYCLGTTALMHVYSSDWNYHSEELSPDYFNALFYQLFQDHHLFLRRSAVFDEDDNLVQCSYYVCATYEMWDKGCIHISGAPDGHPGYTPKAFRPFKEIVDEAIDVLNLKVDFEAMKIALFDYRHNGVFGLKDEE